jgi:hypothetical protein
LSLDDRLHELVKERDFRRGTVPGGINFEKIAIDIRQSKLPWFLVTPRAAVSMPYPMSSPTTHISRVCTSHCGLELQLE